MKRLIISVLAALSMATFAVADEGMWLLPLLQQMNSKAMADLGCKLTADQIYSINHSSIKDAVVIFGGGCTGEVISDEGLLVTNHHCGYSSIQALSSDEHNYLENGYWAMDRSQEIPVPGLSVTFLVSMEDITKQILTAEEQLRKTFADSADVDRLVSTSMDSWKQTLVDKSNEQNPNCRSVVTSFYNDNVYYMIVYKIYRDVRFVGAPPASIGKFGGETDNWMWPRHTGDFSMFRIYADKDNNPAPYSEDNVPYKPKKYFKVSTKGVKEGDFTFIYGFPGSTREYIHSEGVRYIEEISDPHKVRIRTLRLDIMDKYMGQSQAVRIQYSSKKAGVANAWKKWQGEMKGIRKMKTVATKQAYETAFKEWAKGTEYEGLVEKIDAIYRELEPYSYAADYYTETVRTVEMANAAMSVARIFSAETFNAAQLAETLAAFYKDYHLPIDKECFVAVMKEYEKNMPADSKPEYYKSQMEKYQTVEAWAEDLFSNSIYADRARAEALTEADKDAVLADPAFTFFNEFLKWYNADVLPHTQRLNQDLQLAYRDYMRGQMDFAEATDGKAGREAFYPDANLTLRVAYGKIQGYNPADGVYYEPSSTLTGIIEKDNPEIFDYNIPQNLREIYAEKDFGRWTDENGEVPVCFIATNHTTGGNSGSPIIDADGNLIGINFDRVWEGTMSDIVFDPEICRNISLDVRYLLFIIDKVADADHLIEEMTLVE